MTRGDNREKKSGAHGAMVPWCHGADNPSSWLSGYTAPLLSRGGWFEPRGGVEMQQTTRTPFWARERGKEKQSERERG